MKNIFLLPYKLLRLILHIIKTIFISEVNMKAIDNMNGEEFEEFIKAIYSKMGYHKLSLSNISGDFGIDVFCEKDHESYGIQCKRYQRNVGVEAIQQVSSGVKYYNLDHPIVVTNSHFTTGAITLAYNTDVELVDREDLIKLIKKAKAFKSSIPYYYHLFCLLMILVASYLQLYYQKGLIIGGIFVIIEIIMIIRTINIYRSNNLEQVYQIHEYKNH